MFVFRRPRCLNQGISNKAITLHPFNSGDCYSCPVKKTLKKSSETFSDDLSNYGRSKSKINDFAATPPALFTCPPNKLGQYVFVVFTFALRFAGMGFDALRRINRTGDQNIGTQVFKAFPFVGGNFTQIIQCGFGCTETAPVSFRGFAVAFADEDDGRVGRLLQQRKQRAGQKKKRRKLSTSLMAKNLTAQRLTGN